MSGLLTTFNFRVELIVPGLSSEPLCAASFSEVDGLEVTMQPKTIREGGNNGRVIHLTGPVSYGQLTLKRGMTTAFDLWQWVDLLQQTGSEGTRADGEVTVLAADGQTVQARFGLYRCLPVKVRAPSLNAKDGTVAIEELQLAYERLTLLRP